MKNILILGSTGTIGAYLLETLSSSPKYNILVANRSNRFDTYYENKGIKHFYVDITNPATFENLSGQCIDVVILLAGLLPAAMKGYNPTSYLEVNALGALNVLEFCRKNKIKQIIYPQSHSDVSGHWGTGRLDPYIDRKINYNDDHTVYVISKIAAQELIHHYFIAYSLNYVVFRCPNIYAYLPIDFYYVNGKKVDIAYRKLIKKAINSEDIEIWGDCSVKRDVVYIKDFIKMVSLAIDKEICSGIYNVSNGQSVSLDEQIKTIVDVFSPPDNKSKIYYRPDIPIINRNHQYDISNAINDLGFRPFYFLREMFEDMKCEMESGRYDYMI